jgi:DNA-binding transcriptional ArsR family regulator/2-polyprenyl-3-methyl-5-hydroxy-6-metoxy-1,4-benzoquinol methylase
VQARIEADKRWELYRVLGEPARLRLLALVAADELSVGELGELVEESQPNVSRHLAALRKLGLLRERRHGTRVFIRLRAEIADDAVVRDALAAGHALCESEGVLARLPELIRQRDSAAREFFGTASRASGDQVALPAELPAYLSALSWLLPRRELAIEVGTGDGRLLEALAPMFNRVVAVDRERAQLNRAGERLAQRGHTNVELLCSDLSDTVALLELLGSARADVVIASRVIHHAPRPQDAFRTLAELVRPGGALLVLDYAPHDDEAMREQQADLWLGFSSEELVAHAEQAGLEQAVVQTLPKVFHPGGPDAHLTWHVLVARRPLAA